MNEPETIGMVLKLELIKRRIMLATVKDRMAIKPKDNILAATLRQAERELREIELAVEYWNTLAARLAKGVNG